MHITNRRSQLPEDFQKLLKSARKKLGLSQAELGKKVGLPQMHISGIETGKIVPRYDTLLDLVRVLGFDLIPVPRQIIPLVRSLIRRHEDSTSASSSDAGEGPLYSGGESEKESTDES